MNSRIAFRWFVAVFLLVTVGWKAAVQADNLDYPKEAVVRFLERNDFVVAVGQDSVNYMPVIRATTSTCELQVARLTPDGSNRDLIRHLAAGADRSFVVFRGAVYSRQPVFWTVLDDLWSRLLREIGIVQHLSPVLHVAESSSCSAERLRWSEL